MDPEPGLMAQLIDRRFLTACIRRMSPDWPLGVEAAPTDLWPLAYLLDCPPVAIRIVEIEEAHVVEVIVLLGRASAIQSSDLQFADVDTTLQQSSAGDSNIVDYQLEAVQ